MNKQEIKKLKEVISSRGGKAGAIAHPSPVSEESIKAAANAKLMKEAEERARGLWERARNRGK